MAATKIRLEGTFYKKFFKKKKKGEENRDERYRHVERERGDKGRGYLFGKKLEEFLTEKLGKGTTLILGRILRRMSPGRGFEETDKVMSVKGDRGGEGVEEDVENTIWVEIKVTNEDRDAGKTFFDSDLLRGRASLVKRGEFSSELND